MKETLWQASEKLRLLADWFDVESKKRPEWKISN